MLNNIDIHVCLFCVDDVKYLFQMMAEYEWVLYRLGKKHMASSKYNMSKDSILTYTTS